MDEYTGSGERNVQQRPLGNTEEERVCVVAEAASGFIQRTTNHRWQTYGTQTVTLLGTIASIQNIILSLIDNLCDKFILNYE